MAESIVVTVSPARITVKPGEQGTVAVAVRNRSEEVAQYWLRVEGVEASWRQVAPEQLSAFPLQEAQAQIILRPPAGAPGATYHLTVRAVLQEREEVEGHALVDLDVPAPAQTAPPPPKPEPRIVTPGPTTAFQIEVKAELVQNPALLPPACQWHLLVHNAGNVLDTFSFNILGIPPQWVNVEPTELALQPDEQGSATLTIQPTADIQSGAYPFTLRTFSHLNLSQRTELPLRVEVTASAAFKATIFPTEAESQGQREFKLTLASDPASNTDMPIDLSASDQDNACNYTFEPSQVLLPARKTVTSALQVRPHGVLAPNERRTYTFTVVATARKLVAPQAVQARLTQIGAVPLSLNLRPKIQTADLQAEYNLIAVNPAGVQITLLFSGEDPEAICEYAIQPTQLTLPPASEAQATIRVKARDYLDAEAQKQIPFTIWGTRSGELVPAAKVEGTFVQRPLKPVTLELVPPQQSRHSTATYFVRSTNPRTQPVEVLLEARDEADALLFSFAPSMIRLSPGAVGQAKLVVRPKDRLIAGEQRRIHHFAVSGRADGTGTPVAINGTLAQVGGVDVGRIFYVLLRWLIWLVKWVIVAAIIALLAQIALVGLMFLAPQNSSADRLINLVPWPVVRFLTGLPSQRVIEMIMRALIPGG